MTFLPRLSKLVPALLLGLLPGLFPAVAGAQPAAAGAAASAASAPLTHRPLRSNQPPVVLPPTTPGPISDPPGAPAYTVVPRQQHLTLFPCSQCHKLMPVNTTPRQLVAAPHPAALKHGQGRMWCLDCHQANDRDVLHGISGNRIGFNDSSQLCAQCHSARQRDWVFGAHGKRVADWRGARQLYACTHCHDPHNPALAPRAPSAPPPVRAGLEPMAPVLHDLPELWKLMQPGATHGPARQP
jgi:hypothetical protein